MINLNILYFTSLLLGLFIILNIIYYSDFNKNYIEKFKDNVKSEEPLILIKYPENPMRNNDNSKMSSYYQPHNPYPQYLLFNHNKTDGIGMATGYHYSKGNSNRETISEFNYKGEYVMVKFDVSFTLKQVKFYPRNGFLNRVPGKFRIYGTNDIDNFTNTSFKSGWHLIHDQKDILSNYSFGNGKTVDISTNKSYSIYILIVSQLSGDGNCLNFTEWELYGYENKPIIQNSNKPASKEIDITKEVDIQNSNKPTSKEVDIQNSNEKIKDDELGKLIKKNYVFINSYKEDNISNNDLRWYNDNINKNSITLTDINTNHYFNYNNPINTVDTNIIKLTKGALLKNVELKGPNSLYFANEPKNYEINKFTLMFMVKFNNITGVNTLFEMLCNTSAIDDINEKNEPIYVANSISISILTDDNLKYKIEIVMGSSKYIINNIDRNILIGNDLVSFSLAFNSMNLEFMINNTLYKLKYDNNVKNKIIAGSLPITINKTGELDIILYSFAYFKEFLKIEDINKFKIYNNNFLYGLNSIENSKLETLEKVKKLEDVVKSKDNEIININERLDKCSKSKMYELTSKLDNCLLKDYNNDKYKIENINELELDKIKVNLPNGGKNINNKCIMSKYTKNNI